MLVEMTEKAGLRGRPRQFDEDQTLDAALDLFWRDGYRATTTRDLESALGVSQSSLYNAFGSKRDMLLRAIDRYETRVERELLSVLEGPHDGSDAVDAFIASLGAWIEANEHRGCLVVNLMVSEATDPVIAGRVQEYRAKIRRALFSALQRSPDVDDVEAGRRADMVLAAVLGLHITARSGGESSEVVNMVKGLRHEIATWGTP